MKKLYLLYSTDEHHSRSYYNLIGVFDEQHKAIRAANEYDGYNLTDNDNSNLETIGQTQGREQNYLIDIRTLNEIV